MASRFGSSCSRIIMRSSRTKISSSSSSKPFASSSSSSSSSSYSSLPRSSSSSSSSASRNGFTFSRIPPRRELGCFGGSMMPLHTAVADARMTSRLSTTSQCARDLSQELGLSTPR